MSVPANKNIWIACRAFGLAAVLGLGATVASAQDAPATLDPATAQCIRDNAANVEAAVPDLNAAVDFLTTKICAEPVARQNRLASERLQEKMAARWKDTCDRQKAAANGNKTASPMAGFCATMGTGPNTGWTLYGSTADDDEDGLTGMMSVNAPPAATALAARLLLDLRRGHKT